MATPDQKRNVIAKRQAINNMRKRAMGNGPKQGMRYGIPENTQFPGGRKKPITEKPRFGIPRGEGGFNDGPKRDFGIPRGEGFGNRKPGPIRSVPAPGKRGFTPIPRGKVGFNDQITPDRKPRAFQPVRGNQDNPRSFQPVQGNQYSNQLKSRLK